MKVTLSTIAAWLLALLGIAAAREAQRNAEQLSAALDDLSRALGRRDD